MTEAIALLHGLKHRYTERGEILQAHVIGCAIKLLQRHLCKTTQHS